jgi:hypothetical protein
VICGIAVTRKEHSVVRTVSMFAFGD